MSSNVQLVAAVLICVCAEPGRPSSCFETEVLRLWHEDSFGSHGGRSATTSAADTVSAAGFICGRHNGGKTLQMQR